MRRPMDLNVRTLTVQNKLVINRSGDLATISPDGWFNVELPNQDEPNWVPAQNTHYSIGSFTTERTLTLTQSNINAAYPDAPDKTMIKFDFHPTIAFDQPDPNDPMVILPYRFKYFNLVIQDLFSVQDESSSEPPRTYEYVQYINSSYLLKQGGRWIIVMPNLITFCKVLRAEWFWADMLKVHFERVNDSGRLNREAFIDLYVNGNIIRNIPIPMLIGIFPTRPLSISTSGDGQYCCMKGDSKKFDRHGFHWATEDLSALTNSCLYQNRPLFSDGSTLKSFDYLKEFSTIFGFFEKVLAIEYMEKRKMLSFSGLIKKELTIDEGRKAIVGGDLRCSFDVSRKGCQMSTYDAAPGVVRMQTLSKIRRINGIRIVDLIPSHFWDEFDKWINNK